MTPTLVRLVLETEFLQGAGKVFVPQLNGYDIFMALLIDVQDCGENRSHRAAFGAISLPLLNQPIPYSFRWVDPYLCVWLRIDSKRDEDGAILLERRIAPVRFQLIAIPSKCIATSESI